MSSFPATQTLFQSVADQLRARIDAGHWPYGSRIPTEAELARTYSVSINTVRRAVDLLVADEVVTRRQGSGTYVTVHRQGAETRFIGVIVPSTSYYFPSVISGIERVTGAAGARMILASSDYDSQREIVRIEEMLDAGISGLLIAPTLHLDDASDLLSTIRGLPIPAVLLERRPPAAAPDDPLSYVSTDVEGGAHAAVRVFAELGRSRIGFLGRSDTVTAAPLFEGFRRALTDFGLETITPAVVRRPEWTQQHLQEYARTALEQRLDGVFCLGDREATALLPRLRTHGIAVPQDLSVIAYDDEVADIAEVPLSAVSPPKAEIGRLAANTLLRHMASTASAPAATRILLQPHVVLRDSTVAIAAADPAPAEPEARELAPA